VSLLGVGICSVPERITEVVLSFTRAVCKQSAELPILFLKRRRESFLLSIVGQPLKLAPA
jgi:hypothetical protein